MKLGKSYDEEDYEKAIMVSGLRHEERQREIENEKKLDEAQTKKEKNKGQDSSKPESSDHTDNR
jgi:hypothetical protein